MENYNIEYLENVIKPLIKQQIRNSLKFLDDKINEFQESTRLKINDYDDKIDELIKESTESKELINKLISTKKDDKNKIVLLNEKLKKCANEEMTDAQFETCVNKILDLKIDLKNSNDIRVSDIDYCLGKIQKFSSRSDENDTRFEGIEKRQLELLNLMKKEEEENSKSKKDDHKSREKFEKETANLILEVREELNKDSLKIESIQNLVQQSDQRIKQDSSNLSKEIQNKYAKFMEEFQSKLLKNINKMIVVDEKLDGLQQEVIMAKKGGKVDKEIDDFMKQVGYNAKQIAKINQLLESK